VLPYCQGTIVEDEAAVSVGHRFGELLTYLLTGLLPEM
jgi:hypothetical protein